MSKIKSALELALEKTKNFTVDKEKMEENKYKKIGKMAVSKLFGESDYQINDSLKGLNNKQKKWMKQGMLDVLLSNFILPKDKTALAGFKKVEQVFYKIINNINYLKTVFTKLHSFFGEYIEEKEHVQELINQQYAPHLKQKEEELSKKLGKEVKIDPAQDPEYVSIVRNNMLQIESKYQTTLTKAKRDMLETLSNEM